MADEAFDTAVTSRTGCYDDRPDPRHSYDDRPEDSSRRPRLL